MNSKAEVIREHTAKIESTRKTLWSAKSEFETQKKREWELKKSLLSQDTYRAVWDAKADGVPVTAIATAYGVSNRSVIYAVLREMPENYVPATIEPAEVNNSPAEPDNPDSAVAQWDDTHTTATFTYPGGEETVVVEGVDIPGRKFRFTADTTATPEQRQDMNKARRDPDHWLWTTLGVAA